MFVGYFSLTKTYTRLAPKTVQVMSRPQASKSQVQVKANTGIARMISNSVKKALSALASKTKSKKKA